MNKPKFIFKVFLLLCVVSFTNLFAQTTDKQPVIEPSYDVVLQVLIASNTPGGKSSVPPSLATAVKKLKTFYSFSDYRLETTFLERTGSSVEYKSVMSDFTQNQTSAQPIFSEWSLRGLRKLPAADGRHSLQIDGFRFGARIPMVIRSEKDESGKINSSINYEVIGINSGRFGLNENEPTVVGSLTTARPDEMIFLVLTVKSVE